MGTKCSAFILMFATAVAGCSKFLYSDVELRSMHAEKNPLAHYCVCCTDDLGR
jgi:hypothetical protein